MLSPTKHKSYCNSNILYCHMIFFIYHIQQPCNLLWPGLKASVLCHLSRVTSLSLGLWHHCTEKTKQKRLMCLLTSPHLMSRYPLVLCVKFQMSCADFGF